MSIVLMYHRVIETDLDPYNLAVTPSHFREHLDVIRKLTSPMPLLDVVNNWSDSANDIAITFDDGYADNLYGALPILEEKEIPATIFISTGLLDRTGFWVDRLARCLLDDRTYPDMIVLEAGEKKHEMDLRTPENRRTAHRYLLTNIRNLHPEVIEKTLEKLSGSLGIDPAPPGSDRPLTSQEAAGLVSHPLIDLGGHTVRHPCLPFLKSKEQLWEMETCKKVLMELGAPEKLAFAYPFGDRVSYALNTRYLAWRSGWECAVTAETNKVFWFSRYAVPRYYIGDWDGDEFQKRLMQWMRLG